MKLPTECALTHHGRKDEEEREREKQRESDSINIAHFEILSLSPLAASLSLQKRVNSKSGRFFDGRHDVDHRRGYRILRRAGDGHGCVADPFRGSFIDRRHQRVIFSQADHTSQNAPDQSMVSGSSWSFRKQSIPCRQAMGPSNL